MSKFNSKKIYTFNKLNPNKIIFESSLEYEEHFIELKDDIVTEHYINRKNKNYSYSVVSKSMTKEMFLICKADHDNELRKWDNTESLDGKMTCSINELENTNLLSAESPQDILCNIISDAEAKTKQIKRKEAGLDMFSKLTEIQKRRYKMYFVDGLSTYEIAEKEGVDHKAIWFSIKGAEKKLNKFKKSF